MNLKEMNLTYKKRRVITYNADGTKALYHNKEVAPIIDNIFVGKFKSSEYGNEHCDLYVFWPGVKVGLYFGSPATYTSICDIIDRVYYAGFDTESHFIARIAYAIRKQNHIRLIELLMLEHIAPVLVAPAWKARETYYNNYHIRKQNRHKENMEKSRLFVKEKRKEFDSAINGALDTIRNGGTLENTTVTIYRTEYDHSSYSIVNYLMRKYGVNCPLRTQGWINNKLVSVVVDGGNCDTVKYWKRNNGRVSQVFFRCMNELINKVNNGLEVA